LAARWRLTWVLLGLTVVTVAMVPLATGSGEVLEEMVKENGLVERHAGLGDDYRPYAFALLVGAVAVAGLQWIEGSRARQERAYGGDSGDVSSRRRAPRWLVIVSVVGSCEVHGLFFPVRTRVGLVTRPASGLVVHLQRVALGQRRAWPGLVCERHRRANRKLGQR